MTRRFENSRGDKEYLCEHSEIDKATGVNTRLLDAMSSSLAALLIRALPNTKSGFPHFVTMCGQCHGRISEFTLREQRYEVVVQKDGAQLAKAKLLEVAEAYLLANGDEGVLDRDERDAISQAIALLS